MSEGRRWMVEQWLGIGKLELGDQLKDFLTKNNFDIQAMVKDEVVMTPTKKDITEIKEIRDNTKTRIDFNASSGKIIVWGKRESVKIAVTKLKELAGQDTQGPETSQGHKLLSKVVLSPEIPQGYIDLQSPEPSKVDEEVVKMVEKSPEAAVGRRLRDNPWLAYVHLPTSAIGKVPRTTMDTSSEALRKHGRIKMKGNMKKRLKPMKNMRFLENEVVETMVEEVVSKGGTMERQVVDWKHSDLRYQAIR